MKNSTKDFFKTIHDDLKDTANKSDIKFDFDDTINFYLTKEQKERLKTFGIFKKCFFIPIWLFKKLFEKLTPGRRVIFVIGIILLLTRSYRQDYSFLGIVLIIFLLLLELKDKLIAKDELKAGHVVQMAFMPEPSPFIPGYEVFLFTSPANNVGGDMVDFIQLDKDLFGIAIADISGKELDAALHMVKLQSIFRTLVSENITLSGLASKINSIFYRDSEKKRFASMLYLQLDTKQDNVKFFNAGHFPPLLVKGGDIFEFKKGELVLGVHKSSKYSEQILKLESGNTLLLYSDGVTEAMDKYNNFFGDKKLKSLLKNSKQNTAQEIATIILKEVEQFIGNSKIHDDLSLVVIKKS